MLFSLFFRVTVNIGLKSVICGAIIIKIPEILSFYALEYMKRTAGNQKVPTALPGFSCKI